MALYKCCIYYYYYLFIYLSRRLDRCDRMIQNESSDPNGGTVCLLSAVTLRHNANHVPSAQTPACNFHCDVHVAAENKHTLPPFGSPASLSIAMAIKA